MHYHDANVPPKKLVRPGRFSHRSANYDTETGGWHTRDRIRMDADADRIDGFDGLQQGLSVRERSDPSMDDLYPEMLDFPSPFRAP